MVLLPHEATTANTIYFVLNAMAATAHHNQFMIELGKKYKILF